MEWVSVKLARWIGYLCSHLRCRPSMRRLKLDCWICTGLAYPVSSGELSGWLKCVIYLHCTIYLLTQTVLILEMPDFSQRCTVKGQELPSFRKGNSSWREGQKKYKNRSKPGCEDNAAGYLESLWDLLSLEIFKT